MFHTVVRETDASVLGVETRLRIATMAVITKIRLPQTIGLSETSRGGSFQRMFCDFSAFQVGRLAAVSHTRALAPRNEAILGLSGYE